MPESMPLDGNMNPVPVMRPKNGSDYEISVSAASARNATEISHSVAALYATVGLFIKMGDATVTAASDDYDAYIPAKAYREFEIGANSHIAAIRESEDGTLYVNGLE